MIDLVHVAIYIDIIEVVFPTCCVFIPLRFETGDGLELAYETEDLQR